MNIENFPFQVLLKTNLQIFRPLVMSPFTVSIRPNEHWYSTYTSNTDSKSKYNFSRYHNTSFYFFFILLIFSIILWRQTNREKNKYVFVQFILIESHKIYLRGNEKFSHKKKIICKSNSLRLLFYFWFYFVNIFWLSLRWTSLITLYYCFISNHFLYTCFFFFFW